MNPLVLELPLPEYSIDSQPDYAALGAKIDRAIEERFSGKDIAIRAISSMDHPQLTLDALAKIVLKTGTDKYDSRRKGVCYEDFEPYHADFQAGFCTVGKNSAGEGADIIKKFYENVLLDRGYRSRIDLIIIYNLHQVVRAEKVEKEKPGVDARLEPYLFRFKNPGNKKKALLGIIKLL